MLMSLYFSGYPSYFFQYVISYSKWGSCSNWEFPVERDCFAPLVTLCLFLGEFIFCVGVEGEVFEQEKPLIVVKNISQKPFIYWYQYIPFSLVRTLTRISNTRFIILIFFIVLWQSGSIICHLHLLTFQSIIEILV